MWCEKTGCVGYSDEYGCWFMGDLYQLGQDIYILKIAQKSYKPIWDVRHITFHKIDTLWDTLKPYGVLICSNATYHGYEGISDA